MPQWRVRDVMTTEVSIARDDTSYAEIAATLARERISAVPIVNRFDVVVGVVSWTDLKDKIILDDPDATVRAGWRRRTAPLRWPSGTVAEVMSSPPLTIEPDASLPAAARMMYRHNVGRLLVVDDNGRLRGIVTRSDLLKVHARLDAVIRDEVTQRVLRRTLMIEPGRVQATVDDGVVTLTGRTAHRTTALAAAQLTEAVVGVTAVNDRLAFDVDDTVAPAEPTDRQPQLDWWIKHRPGRPAGRGAAGDRLPSHNDQKATASAALQ